MGWYGFNAGSALSAGPVAAYAISATTVASCVGVIIWSLLSLIQHRHVHTVAVLNGAIAGMAGITPASGYIESYWAAILAVIIVLGAYAGIWILKGKLKIDDALDVSSVLGNNSYGQLGLGHTDTACKPTLVQVEELSEGPLRCLVALPKGVTIVDSQGGVFSAGICHIKAAPSQTTPFSIRRRMRYLFQRAKNIPPMLGISCGDHHTLAQDESGDVWTWGNGLYGQLGRSNTSSGTSDPALAPLLKGMSGLLACGLHSLAFPQEGGLLVFGANNCGQLGLNLTCDTGVPTPTLCPVQPALPHSFANRSTKKNARFL